MSRAKSAGHHGASEVFPLSKSRTLALLATLIWMMTMTPNAIAWTRPQGPCNEPRFRITRDMGLTETHDRAHAVVGCVFRFFGMADQLDTAQYVVGRESGWNPRAKNPWEASACRPYSSSPYGSCGLAQHLARYWPGRVSTYLHRTWFPNTWPEVPVLQARANALVTVLMVRAGGWGPWSL